MKIELVKQTFRDDRGYKILKKDWCCERLRDNPLIALFDETMQFDDNDTPQMAIHEIVYTVDYDAVFDEDFYYPITHCPFCGKKIEIKIVKEEDVTERYNAITEQIESIRKRIRSTDSKKKESELRHLWNDLDKELNKFYCLDDYEEGE